MHKTDAGEKRKTLKRDARDLEKEVKALTRTKQMEPARRIRQEEADRLKAEAEVLKDKARLEDLNIWQMEKEKATKKGSKTYGYWIASWREGGKVRNVHLGSCRKMDAEAARQKARKMKAEALGILTYDRPINL
jgi:regulator of replication initiation timing